MTVITVISCSNDPRAIVKVKGCNSVLVENIGTSVNVKTPIRGCGQEGCLLEDHGHPLTPQENVHQPTTTMTISLL